MPRTLFISKIEYLTDVANPVEGDRAGHDVEAFASGHHAPQPESRFPLYGRAWYFPFIKWQDAAIALIVKVDPARVRVYSCGGHEFPATGSRVIRNYVHSKVGIVDNKWATVGSANLDGFSLFEFPVYPAAGCRS